MKTRGESIASNLHACQIISGRDVERVANQIDRPDPLFIDVDRDLAAALAAYQEKHGETALKDFLRGYLGCVLY